MNKYLKDDLSRIIDRFTFHKEFLNKTVLVTGSTGLIGSILVKSLSLINENYNLGIKIIAHARNENKLSDVFNGIKGIEYVVSDITQININSSIDFIFHCAAPTSSKFYVERSVDTIDSIVLGTKRVLELSLEKNVKSIVFLSSLEIYGELNDNIKIDEKIFGPINSLDVRSSYSLGKKMAECLSFSYYSQYALPVKIARLTQVFGPGISDSDNRVFSQFSKSIIEKRDIVLHTRGESSKPYCYTTDAVLALIYIIIKGQSGESYNIANPKTYISIKDMAYSLANRYNLKVVIDEYENKGYAPDYKLNLDVSKLMNLGWQPNVKLDDMFDNTILFLNAENEKQ